MIIIDNVRNENITKLEDKKMTIYTVTTTTEFTTTEFEGTLAECMHFVATHRNEYENLSIYKDTERKYSFK